MSNVLLSPSPLAYELPEYDKISLDDFREAIQQGLSDHQAEIEAISNQAESSDSDRSITFENTVVAYEKTGTLLSRALLAFYAKVSSDGDDDYRDYAESLAPVLADHQTWLLQNQKLFERIDYLYQRIDELDLDQESKTVLTEMWKERKLAGVDLDEETRGRVQDLKSRISSLEASFDQRVTKDRNDSAVIFDSAEDLDGLTDEQLDICSQAAKAKGLDGKYVVELVNTTGHPFQLVLTNRQSRKRIFEAQTSVGSRSNDWDTKAICIELAQLRAELAAVFGFVNHMGLATAIDSTAKSAQDIEDVVYPMAAAARKNAESEAVSLQQLADQWADDHDQPRFQLAAWDWEFFANLASTETLGFDESYVKNFFEYQNVLEKGVFYAANKLFGITFESRPDLKAFHPDIRIYEVFDSDGSQLALFLHDPYARPTKEGGAWMTNIVEQSRLLGQRPVIINCLNIPKPAAGQPTLLTLDEVTTMFHEFGHAIHGILSDVYLPSVEGTSVARDFVEFPSQINEMWATEPEVLRNYAKHWQTGEVLDEKTIEFLAEPNTFNEGYKTSEYLAAALLDQEWHRIPAGTRIESVAEFEASALDRIGLANPLIPPRYSSTYFRHTFAGGYDGAYYSYIWSEILAAEAEEWFRDQGGLTRANGQHFRDTVLSRGRSRPEMESFVAFLGREPQAGPLKRKRGLE